MGIYIKGMKMPKGCYETSHGYVCPYLLYCEVYTKDKPSINKRPEDCPLIEIKEPHGRLIDADELAECASQAYDEIGHMWLDYFTVDYQDIENAPTIIEEEGE